MDLGIWECGCDACAYAREDEIDSVYTGVRDEHYRRFAVAMLHIESGENMVKAMSSRPVGTAMYRQLVRLAALAYGDAFGIATGARY